AARTITGARRVGLGDGTSRGADRLRCQHQRSSYSPCAVMMIVELDRPTIDKPEPAPRHPIDEPETDDHERQPRDEQADAERGHHEGQAEGDPQEPPPKCADL